MKRGRTVKPIRAACAPDGRASPASPPPGRRRGGDCASPADPVCPGRRKLLSSGSIGIGVSSLLLAKRQSAGCIFVSYCSACTNVARCPWGFLVQGLPGGAGRALGGRAALRGVDLPGHAPAGVQLLQHRRLWELTHRHLHAFAIERTGRKRRSRTACKPCGRAHHAREAAGGPLVLPLVLDPRLAGQPLGPEVLNGRQPTLTSSRLSSL